MIVLYESALIIIGMVHHFTANWMLDVEEIVKKIHRPVNWVSASSKFFKFLLGIDLSAVRCFDKDSVKCV